MAQLLIDIIHQISQAFRPNLVDFSEMSLQLISSGKSHSVSTTRNVAFICSVMFL